MEKNAIDSPLRIQPAALSGEPVYAGRPTYSALVFGPSPQSVVWLASDDEHIYVDRHSSGKLSDTDACVLLPAARWGVPIDLGEVFPDELPQPVHLKLHQFLIGTERTVYLHAWFADGKREGASPVWSSAPQSAPVVYFYGPLTFALADPSFRFASGEATKLEVMIGRPGIGERSFSWRNHSDIPRHLHPLARISVTANGSNRIAQYALDQRCCGCRFHRLISLELEPSPGTAQIDVTFNDWLTDEVVPARFSVPVTLS